MQINVNCKIIKDAVHGFIYINREYCSLILDTPHFQRLKRIEQTNARPLFPCAHHDRFIHSIGTFHLGSLAYQALKANSESELSQYNLPWSDALTHFELACLLHDVGHAPFSHTFEGYYAAGKGLDSYITNKSFIKTKRESDFNRFLDDYNKKSPKPKEHEIVSAFLVLTEFYKTLEDDFKVNPFIVARMILGLQFSKITDKTDNFYNCLISLLNGETIDVDKLDYIARDQWATGYTSKNVDGERLLSSMYIKVDNNSWVICFHKRAISELISLIEVKKSIAVSLHSHHTVKYDEHVLTKAVEETCNIHFNGQNQNSLSSAMAISKVVNVESLLKKNCKKVPVFLPTDDDLIHIIKKYINESGYAQEWFSRQYRLKPVWKTYADYLFYFGKLTNNERFKLFENIEVFVKEYLVSKGRDESDYYVRKYIDSDDIKISIPNIKIFIKEKVVNYRDVKYSRRRKSFQTYFLLYMR